MKIVKLILMVMMEKKIIIMRMKASLIQVQNYFLIYCIIKMKRMRKEIIFMIRIVRKMEIIENFLKKTNIINKINIEIHSIIISLINSKEEQKKTIQLKKMKIGI